MADGVIDEISFIWRRLARYQRLPPHSWRKAWRGKLLLRPKALFEQFHNLIKGKLNPDKDPNVLGKLAVFSGFGIIPARVKSASLSWHTTQKAHSKKRKQLFQRNKKLEHCLNRDLWSTFPLILQGEGRVRLRSLNIHLSSNLKKGERMLQTNVTVY